MQNPMGDEVSSYSVYPEVHVGGPMFEKFLVWDIYYGYWNDGVKKPFYIMDAVTYSYSSNLVGTRIYFYPQDAFDEFILPLKLIAGLSYHSVKERYVGGFDLAGTHGDGSSIEFLSLDIGLGSEIKIIDVLALGIEGNVYFPLKTFDLVNPNGFSSLKMGLIYRF